MLLFVVDAMTRGIVSMNEATEMVTRGRNVVLVVEFVPVDASVDGKTLETREIKVCAKAPAREARKPPHASHAHSSGLEPRASLLAGPCLSLRRASALHSPRGQRVYC